MNSSYKLFEQVIALSRASDWENAKKEWEFKGFSQGNADETCLCGKCSISKIFTLFNKHTRCQIALGSSCINKFIPFTDQNLRKNAIQVLQDNTKQFDLKIMNQCLTQGIIEQNDLFYYAPIGKRKSIDPWKLEHRVEVNMKIASRLMDISNL
ncbi:hypothetical protein B4926_19005 [Vibrio cholerae]|uniref:hypothetical protein n=1 Tax=Vibrio cholerae TaxID=666 RepID=UPI000841BA89|nr:hypothetical protein [Vibrio cholerae]EKA4523340.1 hypothetical protein [Vibrio cholerae]EKE8763197.1 hypothetical protein [Vibrio cholerae]MCD1253486.1 hypothetical protein [Vibrio cholerae]TQQ29619.1 hypothetical protein FLL70_19020 [Vibrio cholerae]